MKDWKVFRGAGEPHWGLEDLTPPPPWRLPGRWSEPKRPVFAPAEREAAAVEAMRAKPFITSPPMVLAVNTAIYLRRPLLITGKPGSGKSTLISRIAYELNLGAVLRWPINSRASVRSGLYEYDAIGRLQAREEIGAMPPPEQYLTLGPLGTALLGTEWPAALLIDEIDKSDLDFANDLLNVIEEGEYEIPELRRIGLGPQEVRDFFGRRVTITGGQVRCGQFPIVVMTSNAEREFPVPFLRRCVRLSIQPPGRTELEAILQSHLGEYGAAGRADDPRVKALLEAFLAPSQGDRATDQLLNALFLTVGLAEKEARSFDAKELKTLEQGLLKPLSDP